MAEYDIQERTIAEVQAGYRDGSLTARTVTQAYLDRIAAYDKRGPYLNALITVNPHALDEADRLDASLRETGKLQGPLHGIPVIVKDNLDTLDLPTTSGVKLFKDFIPPQDAFVVARLRQAGAIVLAKASLSELSMGLADCINSVQPGFTRNPYNTAYASGGSSGGTAVALAANFGMVGLGTDTGGSVRAPASINNLVGIRPTVGLVSRTGMGPLDSQRDTPGPMGRTVEDVARLLDVIAGEDPLDPRTAGSGARIPTSYTSHLQADGVRGARIGIFRQTLALPEGADSRVVDLFDRAVADLAAAGATTVEDFNVPGFADLPRPPQTAARARADWEALFAYEGPSFPVRTVAELRDARCVHPLHAPRIAEVAVANAPDVDSETLQGRRDEQHYRDVLSAAFEAFRVEALAFPVWTYPPVLNGDRGQSPQGALTFVGSATQWPVIVVPIGFVGERLPIGMQLLGLPWTEARLVELAYGYEQATRHRRAPNLVHQDG